MQTLNANPQQHSVALVNDEPGATPVTDWRAADALARQILRAPVLARGGHGRDYSGRPTRTYASQAY